VFSNFNLFSEVKVFSMHAIYSSGLYFFGEKKVD
jgi:hypothetical protein